MGFQLTLKEIAEKLGGQSAGEESLTVSGLSIDSRTVVPSPDTLFIALSGEQHDGHDYIRELYDRGMRSFLVERIPAGESFEGAGFCQVKDTMEGLQALATVRREAYTGTVAAITGSNGKTIVKEWIYQLLSGEFPIHRSPKSYNSQVGVPLTVWMTGQEDALALIEAGISRPGEMDRLERIIRPRIGIFTNLGGAHQENFKDLEHKLKEKLRLFRNCDRIICRSDQLVSDRPLTSYLRSLHGKIITWSLGGDAAYRYTLLRKTGEMTELNADFPGGAFEFHLPFGDDASIENALHALTFALEMGLPAEKAAVKLVGLEPVNMRLEILEGDQGTVLINDTYNSDIMGIVAALDLMDRQDPMKPRIVILSDLLQSGRSDRELYGEVAALMGKRGISRFIGIGPALMHQRDLFPKGALFYHETPDFLKRVDRSILRDSVILIKGSRKYGFERITSDLQLKAHQTVLEIDLNAMVRNLNTYRSLLGEGVKTMVMVKALSYGSGHVEISNLLQYHQVDYLAVAFIDEGVELRKAGIHLPVMVLNPDPSGFDMMLDYRLEPEIYSIRILQSLYKALQYRNLTRYPVHVKLDTGMHRLGFQREDLEDILPWLEKEQFRVTTVFSHLAASGDPAQDAFSRSQIQLFEEMATGIAAVTGETFDRHILNSSGIERFPEAQYQMVRLGIGLHGIGKIPGLKPVSTFRTTISQIREVNAGETIGYSRRGKVERKSRIATLPVGYADGFHRNLGNGVGRVLIGGKTAPVVGDVCMDMTMVDVTGIGAAEGDPVEIFGKTQPVSELAGLAGTIPYEILTSVPERVKRVYLHE
ncbi:MAG: bifunctional UDP-N-acetylmuramoyl-tripeptide:D-alanyl-D-alanine ligase/alanine racemase [Bacteroidales bacterium]